jgi:hypothetical protein
MTIDNSESKVVEENRDKILDLLKEAHTSATSATHVATPGVSGKKRAAPTGAVQLDDDEEEDVDVAAQHIQKFHRNASECAQQLERVVGYHGAVVAGTQDVIKYTSVAEDCSNQLVRINTDAQNLIKHAQESSQQLESFAVKYAEKRALVKECTVDLEVLGTAITKVSEGFVTLTANHKAYLEVKREDADIDAGKIKVMDKQLDFETKMSAFEDAKIMRAKAMLEIEKERAGLKRGAPGVVNNNNEDPTLTTFTINELCKKHKLLEGIAPCHYLDIFKRAGELSAAEHRDNKWKFANRNDVRSNVYPMEYEAVKLVICKEVIAKFKAKQAAGQQRLDAFWAK